MDWDSLCRGWHERGKEIQRLRAALEAIYDITTGNRCTDDDPDGLMLMQTIAKQALGEQE